MKKYVYIILIAHPLLTITANLDSLTLSEFNRYAQAIPEFPIATDLNWLDPDYSDLQISLMPNYLHWWLEKLHILSPKIISLELFSHLLNEALNQRRTLELEKKPVAVVSGDAATRFFVWGSAHGAFHCLVRSVNWLAKQDIIDEHLVIKNPNHYFVFTGDAINRAAYSLEILTLMITLMIRNPNNVIYLRGNQETNQFWQNYGLKRQLQIRGYYLSKEVIPFGSLMNEFFLSLPSILYINRYEKPDDVIIAYYLGIQSKYDPLIDGIYVKKSSPGLSHHALKKDIDTKSDAPLTIRAIIRKENWLKENRAKNGLGLAEQAFGITSWVIRSSPTMTYKTFYNFVYDAFAIINLASPLSNSTIGVCNHDAQDTSDTFIEHTPFNIITGRTLLMEHPEPVGKDIVIGSSMSLEQGIPIVGQRVKQGIDVAINEQNIQGGIHGKHIRLDIRYDKYTPNLTRLNIKNLLSEGTNIILAPIGDPNLNTYVDHIKNGDLLVLFPISGSPKFRNAALKGIAHISASYLDGVENMINYLMIEYASRQFAFLYQDDEAGFEPIKTAHAVLQKNNITKWVDLPYARGSVNFSEQVQKIKNGQVETIGLFSTSHATKEFIRQLDTETISNKIFFGSFLLGDASFKEFSKRKGFHVLLGARVPNPATSQLPIVQEYRQMMDKYNHTYDVFSLESYIGTRLTIELLKTIEGDITQEKLRAAVEGVNNYEFGGFNYTFNPATRCLGRYIWLTTQDNEEWMQRDIIENL